MGYMSAEEYKELYGVHPENTVENKLKMVDLYTTLSQQTRLQERYTTAEQLADKATKILDDVEESIKS